MCCSALKILVEGPDERLLLLYQHGLTALSEVGLPERLAGHWARQWCFATSYIPHSCTSNVMTEMQLVWFLNVKELTVSFVKKDNNTED